MNEILLILLTAVLFGIADTLRKFATGGSSNQLITAVFTFGTFLTPLILLLLLVLKKRPVNFSLPHVGYSFLGGLFAGLGGFLLFYLLSKGMSLTATIPVIRILSIVTVAFFGILLFSEPITFKLLLGMMLALSGIYLVLS